MNIVNCCFNINKDASNSQTVTQFRQFLGEASETADGRGKEVNPQMSILVFIRKKILLRWGGGRGFNFYKRKFR